MIEFVLVSTLELASLGFGIGDDTVKHDLPGFIMDQHFIQDGGLSQLDDFNISVVESVPEFTFDGEEYEGGIYYWSWKGKLYLSYSAKDGFMLVEIFDLDDEKRLSELLRHIAAFYIEEYGAVPDWGYKK